MIRLPSCIFNRALPSDLLCRRRTENALVPVVQVGCGPDALVGEEPLTSLVGELVPEARGHVQESAEELPVALGAGANFERVGPFHS
jgi:hypothetical protein